MEHTIAQHRYASGFRPSWLVCGVIAGPLFIAMALLQAAFRPGFELARHPISLLTLGDFGWIQIANFLISGLLMVAFAVSLYRAGKGMWGPLLIGLFGIGLIIAGLFVPDAAWSFPPGAPDGIPDQLSFHAAMHGVGFMLAFGSVCVACLVFARRALAEGQRQSAVYAVLTAVSALLLSQWPGTDGAAVRYFAAGIIVWTWTTVLAVQSASPRSTFRNNSP